MNKVVTRRTRELERECAELRQRNAVAPIQLKAAGGVADEYRIVIIQGNTLATGQDGINFSASPITDVPTAYDPDTPGTAIDGIGWGELFKNGSSQGYVLVCNDGSGGTTIDFDLLGATPGPDVASVATTKSVTVGGDPLVTLTVYIVKSLIG
jgi:hypothetical protein